MKTYSKKVLNEVFVLTLVVVGLVLIFLKKDSSQMQLYILISAISIYLAWALIYHKIDKSLTLPIFLEYLLTAVLVLILLMGVLLK